MIRPCSEADFGTILNIINDGAAAYRGVIPADRLRDPYMSAEELKHEIASGVIFFGWEQDHELQGVMGVQYVQHVTLIRHAYVRLAERGGGIGGKLLEALRPMARGPILIGTWADSYWAIGFYAKHGFHPVSDAEKARLLRRYWNVPDRQIEASVVLVEADPPDA